MCVCLYAAPSPPPPPSGRSISSETWDSWPSNALSPLLSRLSCSVLYCNFLPCYCISFLFMSCRDVCQTVLVSPDLSCPGLSWPFSPTSVTSCPVLPCPVLCLTMSCPVRIFSGLSCPVLACSFLSCNVPPCPVLVFFVLSCSVSSCLTYPVFAWPFLFCPALSCPALSRPDHPVFFLPCHVLPLFYQDTWLRFIFWRKYARNPYVDVVKCLHKSDLPPPPPLPILSIHWQGKGGR